jgi:hypothetical protein
MGAQAEGTAPFCAKMHELNCSSSKQTSDNDQYVYEQIDREDEAIRRAQALTMVTFASLRHANRTMLS